MSDGVKKARQLDDALKEESLQTCIPQDPSWQTCLEEWDTLTRKFNRMYPFFVVIFWMSLVSSLIVSVQIIHLNYGDSITVFFNQWFLHDWKQRVTDLFEKYKTKFYKKIPRTQQQKNYRDIVNPDCTICLNEIISPEQVYGMIVATNPDSDPHLCRMPFLYCKDCSIERMDKANENLYEYLKQYILVGRQTDHSDIFQKENIPFLLAEAQCTKENVRPILKGFVPLPFMRTRAYQGDIQTGQQVQLIPLLSKKNQ